MKEIVENVFYVGVNDRTLDLFEGQYVLPAGITYNSYVIKDEKNAIMDMVDKREEKDWFDNLSEVLGEQHPDYLVISHLEPDHCANLCEVLNRYPDIQIVSNDKLFRMISQFFEVDIQDRKIVVKEGDVISLGVHQLHFVMAPMVHWPEVMVTYESTAKMLFSADAFGKFGTLDVMDDWVNEARRYYFNIVGKYGLPVQNLLKKITAFDIQMICPLHGPVLLENLEYYIKKYQIWSSYELEDKGVFIAYASMHGNTAQVANKLADLLRVKGEKVVLADLARTDMAKCVENAFRYDRLVVACPTYDGGIMPIMQDFINHLAIKQYQKRVVGIIENGSWAPMAGKVMKEQFAGMKEIKIMEPVVTIRSTMKAGDIGKLKELSEI